MRRALQLLALLLALASAGFWLAAGANRGWTKTSVPKKFVDEVTGQDGITYEQRFVPGVELLGASLFAAGALAGASLFFRRKPTT